MKYTLFIQVPFFIVNFGLLTAYLLVKKNMRKHTKY